MRFFVFAFLVAAAFAELKSTTTFLPEECERKSEKGDLLKMHYTGTIDESSATGEKGKQFDSSVGRGPFEFTIGSGQVIQGWDQGLLEMCVGEKRTLIIPAELGYGDQGAGGDIPGGATLKFVVELVDIMDAPPTPNIFVDIDTNKDNKLTKEEVANWFQTNHGQDLPEELYEREDKDGNGLVDWEEFSGPKGSELPVHDEL